MSRAYGFGLLNSKVNTLTSLLLTSGTPTPTLQQVTDAGATTNDNIILTTSPPSLNQCTLNNAGIIMLQAGNRQTTLQSDGVVAVDIPTGDYGQLLKDRVKFQVGANLTQIVNNGTELAITGQVSFNNPPHSVDAINGNDLVTKGYVDSLVGQYSGGYNFFLNYSVVDGLYRSLGQSVVTAAQQKVDLSSNATNQLVAEFVSSALGITSIPSGIWNVLLYSEVSAPAGVCTYFFELYQLTGATETLITTSGLSADVNSLTTPTAFPINATIAAPWPVALTDKIVLKIYVHKDGTPVNVATYFQNAYYSFSQSTLNAGTTLLSSNNTWTGTNKFALGITSPALDTDTAVTLNFGTVNASGINIGKAGVNTTIAGTAIALTSRIHTLQTQNVGTTIDSYVTTTTGAYNLLTTNTSGLASLFTSAARTATLNIQNASTSANIINIGSATSATNILGLRAATLDSITSSVLSVGSNVLTTGVNLNNKVLSGLTYGVNQFVTLSTNTALPSATQIGYVLSTATASATLSAAAPSVGFNVFTNLPVPAGVWMINYSVRLQTSSATNSTISIYSFNGNGSQTQGQYGISLSTATYIVNNGINSMFGTGSFVVSYTAATNLNIGCFFAGTLVGTISMYPTSSNLLSATRIA
jgi:hypothetical protein